MELLWPWETPREATLPWIRLSEHARRTLKVPGAPDFLALEGNDAWVTNEGRVEKLTADAREPIASVAIAEPCGGMAVDFGALWVADCRSRSLVRVDLASHRVSAEIPTGLADPKGELSVATGAGSVWLLADPAGVLARVDPATNRVSAHIPVPPGSFAAAFGFGSVWVSTVGEDGSGSVQRIDPESDSVVACIPVGRGPRFLAAGAGAVWTLNQGDGTVSRVDPDSNRLAATIPADVAGSGRRHRGRSRPGLGESGKGVALGHRSRAQSRGGPLRAAERQRGGAREPRRSSGSPPTTPRRSGSWRLEGLGQAR